MPEEPCERDPEERNRNGGRYDPGEPQRPTLDVEHCANRLDGLLVQRGELIERQQREHERQRSPVAHVGVTTTTVTDCDDTEQQRTDEQQNRRVQRRNAPLEVHVEEVRGRVPKREIREEVHHGLRRRAKRHEHADHYEKDAQHPRRDDGELDPVRLCAAATPLAHHAVVAAVSHRTTRATLVLGPGSVHDL